MKSPCSSAAASATWPPIEGWLERGVARVILGTVALQDPGAGAARPAATSPARSPSASMPRTARSRSRAGPRPRDVTALDLARKFEDAGVAALIFTDIDRDGLLKGVNVDGTAALAPRLVPVIASGGVASSTACQVAHSLDGGGIVGVISGRALYDGSSTGAGAAAAEAAA